MQTRLPFAQLLKTVDTVICYSYSIARLDAMSRKALDFYSLGSVSDSNEVAYPLEHGGWLPL
jgi:hypothetical protein